MAEEVLLLEGTPPTLGETLEEGGMGDMTGVQRTCVEWQEVYSPALGKYVRRCKRFAPSGGVSGLGFLGQLDFLRTFGLEPETLKNTAITGLLAAGGAVLAKKAADWLSRVGKAEGEEERFKGALKDLVTVGVGIALGTLIGRTLRRPEWGFAFGVGSVALVGMRILGEMLGEEKGGTSGLGIITARKVEKFEPLPSPPTVEFPGAFQVAASSAL